MSHETRPHRRLPRGVTRSLWEYAHAKHIATEYDEYFAYNRLFDVDAQVIARHLTSPGVVVDLGCGTGRALIPLARREFSPLGVDLSNHMLRIVAEKAARERLTIHRIRANLVDLGFLRDASIDYVFTDPPFGIAGNYEGIQADIFDHLLAVIGEFELGVFQSPSGRDVRALAEASKAA